MISTDAALFQPSNESRSYLQKRFAERQSTGVAKRQRLQLTQDVQPEANFIDTSASLHSSPVPCVHSSPVHLPERNVLEHFMHLVSTSTPEQWVQDSNRKYHDEVSSILYNA